MFRLQADATKLNSLDVLKKFAGPVNQTALHRIQTLGEATRGFLLETAP